MTYIKIIMKTLWLKKLVKRVRRFDIRSVGAFFAYYLGGIYDRVDRHHMFMQAGGLSFSAFVCIIPMTLIVFSFVGGFFERPSVANEINTFIDRLIPYEEYATYIKGLVFERVDEFRIYKSLAGWIGLIGLFFAASALFSTMRTALNTVYRIRNRQTVLIGKLRDFGLVLLVMIYFLLSTTVLPGIQIIMKFAQKLGFWNVLGADRMEDLTIGVASFVLIFTAFFIMYLLVPQKKLPRKAILVSALSSAVLWELARYLFGFYVMNVATGNIKRVYGAYALVIVVAFWIYFTSIVFIIGAEIGQLYRERRKRAVVKARRDSDR